MSHLGFFKASCRVSGYIKPREWLIKGKTLKEETERTG